MDLFDPPSRLLLCFSNGSLSFYLFWSERLLNSLLLSPSCSSDSGGGQVGEAGVKEKFPHVTGAPPGFTFRSNPRLFTLRRIWRY